MSAAAADYTVDELVVATLASFFHDGDQACNGMASFVPVAAFMLARATHAPGLTWIASSVGLEPRPARIPASTLEAALWQDSLMYVDQYTDFWNMALSGRWITKFCVGAAQVDRHGNVNNSVIGADYDRPRVRLPGTAGLADLCSTGQALYYWHPDHSRRSFVERVDFISGAGYLDGGDARERLGLTGGPRAVVTNLAVLDFHPVTRRMRLVSVHPGVTVEQVQDATGFDLVLPEGEVPVTRPPTQAQVHLLREVIDPDGLRKSGFRAPQPGGQPCN